MDNASYQKYIQRGGRKIDGLTDAEFKVVQQRQDRKFKTNSAFDSIGALAGIAGSAAYFNPVLAPVAAVGGVAFGAYKLGQSFDLW